VKASGDATTNSASDSGWEHMVRVTVPPSKCSPESQSPCVVNFGYIEDMNSVLAECDTHEGVLDAFDSGDKGRSWPHSAHSGEKWSVLPSRGRPYMWCQHLGGLDLYLLPSVSAVSDGTVLYTFSAPMFTRRLKRLLATHSLTKL
jgi:hypothetical protein